MYGYISGVIVCCTCRVVVDVRAGPANNWCQAVNLLQTDSVRVEQHLAPCSYTLSSTRFQFVVGIGSTWNKHAGSSVSYCVWRRAAGEVAILSSELSHWRSSSTEGLSNIFGFDVYFTEWFV